MAPKELSTNWKKLQDKIKSESAAAQANPDLKRKAGGDDEVRSGPEKKVKKSFSNRPASKPSKPTSKPTSKPAPMGNTQSSKIDTVDPKNGVSPSLALWAAEHDISPEDLAEAYGLGLKGNAMLTETPARPNEGLSEDLAKVGKYVAIDCEMVGVGESGHDSVLARVSVVDFHGRQVYDSFVKPTERVTDWRTHVSGVSPKNMATARPFEEVQAAVAELLKDRILVGHDVKHDLQVLVLDHPPKFTRDTAKFHGFKKYGNGPKPSLRVLAQELLGVEIQTGQHSSIEDARVAMLLFRKHKSAFDMEHGNRYPDTIQARTKGRSTKKTKKRKN
ncbi:ribonuclease H-like domain-containing protein [Bombardia bombarda]|uniref:RNA exonuclease 4 n=1 Tax=Bombardia bombarda TaxID=252184 RepID=A0AA39XNY9_9PEZI|nr:ribonuclease H-like domain-containing protein [Bombardia bombarda]